MAVVSAQAAAVSVRLAEDAESGLAQIMEQFLQQNLAESEKKRRMALRLRGRIAMTDVDHDCTVTLVFAEGGVAILDGPQHPLDATITGPYETLLRLLQGRANPLLEHVRGRLKVRSRVRRLFLPLHVHSLMKLEDEADKETPAWLKGTGVAGALIIAAAGLAAVLWILF